MKKYRCLDCCKTFNEDELETISTTYEEYYGVNGDFPNSNPMSYDACPYCHSESYDEIDEEDEEEE